MIRVCFEAIRFGEVRSAFFLVFFFRVVAFAVFEMRVRRRWFGEGLVIGRMREDGFGFF